MLAKIGVDVRPDRAPKGALQRKVEQAIEMVLGKKGQQRGQKA